MCSSDDVARIATELGERWHVEGTVEIRCVGGRFPALGLFVEARWGAVRRVGVLGLDRARALVPFIELVAEHSVHPIANELLAADLDDNGIDEVIDAWRREHYGASGDQMIVWATDGVVIERIEGPHLNAFRPGLGGCRARAEVGERGVAIIVRTSHGLSPVECLRSGHYRFVIEAGRMVELDRVVRPAEPTPVPSTVPPIFDRSRS